MTPISEDPQSLPSIILHKPVWLFTLLSIGSTAGIACTAFLVTLFLWMTVPCATYGACDEIPNNPTLGRVGIAVVLAASIVFIGTMTINTIRRLLRSAGWIAIGPSKLSVACFGLGGPFSYGWGGSYFYVGSIEWANVIRVGIRRHYGLRYLGILLEEPDEFVKGQRDIDDRHSLAVGKGQSRIEGFLLDALLAVPIFGKLLGLSFRLFGQSGAPKSGDLIDIIKWNADNWNYHILIPIFAISEFGKMCELLESKVPPKGYLIEAVVVSGIENRRKPVEVVPTAIKGEDILTEAPISDRERRGTRWAWRARFWSKRGIAVLTIFSTAVLAGWIVWDVGGATLRKDSLDIESIGVPEKLRDTGFSADVVTRRLRDAIKEVQDRAQTTMEKDRFTIPKAGISAESVATPIRRLLPESFQHVISGEFTLSGAELSVRLRLNGEVVFSDVSTASNAVDTLIDKAAFKLVEKTQPYVAASLLFRKGDLSGATHLADEIIDALPPEDENVMRAYNLKGMAAEQQHEDEKAAAFYLEYPNFALARYHLGHLRFGQYWLSHDQHNLDEAITEFRLAIQLDPKFALPHAYLGTALYYEGKIDDVMREFRLGIQLDPKYALSHYSLGNILSRQGKNEEAIRELHLAIQFDPKYALSHYSLGVVLGKQGKNEEAITQYRSAIQLDPKDAVSHYNLGNVLGRQGKNEEAANEYRLAIQFDPKFAFPRYQLAKILTEQVVPETPQDRAVTILTEACGEIQVGARLAPHDPSYATIAHRIDAKLVSPSHCLLQ